VTLAAASMVTPSVPEMAVVGLATRAVAAASTAAAVTVALATLLLNVDWSGIVRMAETATLAAETRRVSRQAGGWQPR